MEFRRALSHLRRYGPKEGRLLEVGCAYGFFLLEAQRYFQCTGIEVSEAATNFCRSRGLDVHLGIADESSLQNRGQFDAVVMLDVIEHLANPVETLSLLFHALNENGSIMIATGNLDSFLARLMGKRWRLMTPPQHLFYFSRRTLTALLEKIGFHVIHCTMPWKIVPLGLAVYQLSHRIGLRVPLIKPLSSVGVPINLFDTVRLVARKTKR
jgi:2-polyprenyl-3-methyl-5-hydroxy-6-metoxy-1,4-benzoquinol methylase